MSLPLPSRVALRLGRLSRSPRLTSQTLPSRQVQALTNSAPCARCAFAQDVAQSRRMLHASAISSKSKRSFAASVDDSPSRADDDDVPVMRTKGKGAKGAKSSPRGSKSKRGNQEQEEQEDDDRYATSTRNNDLPGERFDPDKLTENMKRAVERCRTTVTQKVGMIGRVDPSILDDLRVVIGKSSNGAQALKEVATVGARNGVLMIHCFDPSYVRDVEKAIYTSPLGLTPQLVPGDEEGALRVPIPKPTVETRKELIKEISRICENARVSIRAARHTAQKQIKADIDNKVIGTSEGKAETKRMEDITKKHSQEIDLLFDQQKKKVEASIEG